MVKPWYRTDPGLFKEVRQEVEDTYPDLRFVDDGSQIILRGWYPLSEGSKVWDRYFIEVTLPTDSRRGFPIVREMGKRIPPIADRHMFTNGMACIALEDAFWFKNPKGLSLKEFLDGPVRSYFASQSLIELGEGQPWSAGEWAHGANGIFQFYSGVIGTKDPLIILEYLKLLEREEVKGHWPCPCKSGEKLRKCHGALVNKLRSRIPRNVAAMSLKRFQEAVTKVISHYRRKI